MAPSVQIEYPEALRRWQAAPQEFRDRLQERFRTYVSYLVQYIKREKLSGQVLGKYEGWIESAGVFSVGSLGNRAKYSVKTGNLTKAKGYQGRLKETFGAQVYNDLEAQFFETLYGAAWETGFHTPTYSFGPLPGNKALAFYSPKFGGVVFRKRVTIKARWNPAKPHIRPSIEETFDRVQTLILRPLVNFITGRK